VPAGLAQGGGSVDALLGTLEARRDARRLAQAAPDLAACREARWRLFDECLPFHRRWREDPGGGASATSLETASFVLHLMETRRPARVLELGTGLLSVLLRAHARARRIAPALRAVDDAPDRLARTRRALERERLPLDGLLPWHRFRDQRDDGFDLLVHRLGATPGAPLATVLGRVRPGGLLLLEGAEQGPARRAARTLLSEAGCATWCLRAQTLDPHGGYALLARA